MTDVTIHPARPRDLPVLQEMIRALSAHHGDAAPVTLSFLQEHLFDSGRACAFLARAGEAPLGHAAAQPAYRALGWEEVTGPGPRFRRPL